MRTTSPILVARDLEKSYGPRTILGGVSLSIHDGERVGLVGINGSGKSTLARILAGDEAADAGAVVPRGDAFVQYLAQEPELDPVATARAIVTSGLTEWSAARARHDEITEQMGRPGADLESLVKIQDEAALTVERLGGWEQMHRVDALMAHLSITRPDGLVTEMSGGERRRVALAQILVARPALAILDEPTNHLDLSTIEWLEDYLATEWDGALVLITHDRYVLDRVVDRTLEIDRGTVLSYDGGWEEYLGAKAERLAQEARVEANRRNFLRRELEWLRRQPKARTGKQKARAGRARSAVARSPTARHEKVARLEMSTTRTGKSIVELRGLGVELGGRTLVRDLDLTLTKGERIGIVGPNGAGKTSLLRALLGELPPSAGEVVAGKNTRFAYFDQTRGGLRDDASILDNVADGRPRVTVGDREVEVRAWLQGFLFDGDAQQTKAGALSGGERGRVLLAKMLLQPANVLLLDEPTNDLDVTTLGALEEMLLDLDGTAIVVTHDRYFLDRVATAILAFEGNGRVVRYAGSYQAYRRARPASRAGDRKAARAEPRTRQKKPLTYAERLELEGLLDAVGSAEARAPALEAALADPELHAKRGTEVPALTRDLDEARAEVERLVARWEDLESKREA